MKDPWKEVDPKKERETNERLIAVCLIVWVLATSFSVHASREAKAFVEAKRAQERAMEEQKPAYERFPVRATSRTAEQK